MAERRQGREQAGAPRGRWALAAIVSIGLLAALATQARIQDVAAALGGVEPLHAGAAFALILAGLASRAVRLRHLLSIYHAPVGMRDSLLLAARHQASFTILPSGSGDLVFPLLAKERLRCPAVTASRVLVAFRGLDAAALLALLAAALTVHLLPHRPGWLAFLLLAIAAAAGVVAPRAAEVAVALHDRGVWWLKRLRRADPRAGEQEARALSVRERAVLVLWSILAWLCAAAAFWFLFAMVGRPVGPAQAVLILGAVNLAGAAALFTLGGLGVSEIGLAGTLVVLGVPVGEAAGLALVVRPAALAMTLAASALCELAARSLPRPAASPSSASPRR